jgi:hypothetical protein
MQWAAQTKKAAENWNIIMTWMVSNDMEFLVRGEPLIDTPNIAPRDARIEVSDEHNGIFKKGFKTPKHAV